MFCASYGARVRQSGMGFSELNRHLKDKKMIHLPKANEDSDCSQTTTNKPWKAGRFSILREIINVNLVFFWVRIKSLMQGI
ncbi:hypothetical protein NIES3974_11940 [Calothrix sp. NIES-3974]|nr:hypothetical protein NIES3974_11940 [Calothrix sp. NIES-3974]